MSRADAAEYAIELADSHLKSLDISSDWQWEVGGATPKIGHGSDRKAGAVWIVGVRWIPSGGGVFDGPGLIEVDLARGEARLIETP